MKKILVLGATSNVGFRFCEKYNTTYNIVGIARNLPQSINYLTIIENKNFCNKAELQKIINHEKPDIIINTVALGNVDECEKNKDLCLELNYKLVKTIVDIAKEKNIFLIHFSTSAIYDGESPLYNEKSPATPINNYGKIKLKADSYIKQNLKKFLLLRPITIIGVNKKFQRMNPATFIINNIIDNKPLKLVDDTYANFLFLDDLIEIMNKLIQNKISGELNLSGDEVLSWYELGLLINNIIQPKNNNITKCLSTDFKTMAVRPKNTSFDNSKIKKAINYKFTDNTTAIKSILNEQFGA